jgi:hypothetical protein
MSEETTQYIGKYEVESVTLEDGLALVTLKDYDGEENPVKIPEQMYNKIVDTEQVEQLSNINDLVVASTVADILALLQSPGYDLSLIQVESVARSISIAIENKEKFFSTNPGSGS